MILIITHRADYTADFLVNKLNQRGVEYIRYNCEDLLIEDHNIDFDEDFSSRFKGKYKFKSIWFRRTKLPEISGVSPSERVYLMNEVDAFLKNLFAVLEGEWLSEPFFVYR